LNGKVSGPSKRGGFSVFFMVVGCLKAFAKNSKKVSLKQGMFAI